MNQSNPLMSNVAIPNTNTRTTKKKREMKISSMLDLRFGADSRQLPEQTERRMKDVDVVTHDHDVLRKSRLATL
jgi:hypothetical protein